MFCRIYVTLIHGETLFLRAQPKQFPVPIPFQEAIEFFHEPGLALQIVLGDVLEVAAHEDQAAGAALAFADGDTGADAALRSFKFGLLFLQFFPEIPALRSRT